MRKSLVCAATVMLASSLFAGPQHWGFGFGYLVTLEEDAGGQRALSVYEPPVHVKDCDWLLRWRDVRTDLANVMPNGLVVGDFWPKPIGEEQAIVITDGAPGTLGGLVLDVPDAFSTESWTTLGEFSLELPWRATSEKSCYHFAACRLPDEKGDAIIVVNCIQLDHLAYLARVAAFTPTGSPADGAWRLAGTGEIRLKHPVIGVAGGDFWGDRADRLALLTHDGRNLHAAYFTPAREGVRTLRFDEFVKTTTPDTPQPQFCTATDFLKDGFAYVATAPDARDEAVAFHVAPQIRERYKTIWVRPDETFAGARLTGQQLGESKQIMTGRRQAAFGRVIAAGAGRVFGYVIPGDNERRDTFWSAWTFQGYDDAEISFAHRTPVYRLGVPKKWQDGNWPWEPDDHYGWPHKDEEVTYHVKIKNNGKETIPAGKITLRAWIDTADRNADTLPEAANAPDFTATLDEPLPPFDPEAPEYATVDVTFKWPYDLIQPEGWTWKKINVREIGERWLVLRIDYAGDENRRNDRYEMALNALLLRPVYRNDDEVNTLAYRAPTVLGDPESKEYITRKLADAVQCMWERSRTSKGEDVYQRVAFVGYRQGWPCNREEDWSYYEGSRELQKWIGLWGDFERFNPADGGAELHETGHLFHRLGDLYHYFVFPTSTRRITMGDGAPVQMYTYAWGRDSFCDGQAILGEGASDLHRYMEGVRYGLGWAWHRMLPAKVYVRVLDRDGQPLPDAQVTHWTCSPDRSREINTGPTDADGRWDTGLPSGENRVFDPLNLPQYEGDVYDAQAHVFTVDLDGYSDFGILGSEDTTSHSRYTLMQQSIISPDEWTWNMPTLYKPGARKPTFDVTMGVQGRQIAINVESQAGCTYRLYRRWEPTYTFELINEAEAKTNLVRFTDDMGAADWFCGGRYRAAYYVTEISHGQESLPKRVYGIAIDNANGVTDLGDGKLLLTVNCGKAEPMSVICDGTTPLVEYMKHFRFGHTAMKIVQSQSNPERYYATLAGADLPDAPRWFDLIRFDKPDRFSRQYPVIQTIASAAVDAFATQAPFTVTLQAPDAGASNTINVGDVAVNSNNPARRAQILEVNGDTFVLDAAIFDEDQKHAHVNIEFGGGLPGSGAENRQLSRPRGLTVLRHDGKEYVAIADTGNKRVVIWDETTQFVTQWSDVGLNPAAVATHPENPSLFFVLDRQEKTGSRLYLCRFDGKRILVEHGYPAKLATCDNQDGTEIGLAAALDPTTKEPVLAVTSETHKAVTEIRRGDVKYDIVKLHTAPIGVSVGTAPLAATDVAYSLVDGELRLFAVDHHNRLIRLR